MIVKHVHLLSHAGDAGNPSAAVLSSRSEPNRSNHSDSPMHRGTEERSEHTKVCRDSTNLKYRAGWNTIFTHTRCVSGMK